MNREGGGGAYAHQVRSLGLEQTDQRVNPWLINDHQMSEKSSDHVDIDDAEYADMVIEMNQMTLMSECSKINRQTLYAGGSIHKTMDKAPRKTLYAGGSIHKTMDKAPRIKTNQSMFVSRCGIQFHGKNNDDLMSEKGSDQSRADDDDDDGYGDMWGEMTLLLEGSKDAASESSAVEHTTVIEEHNDCDHSFMLNDDLGYVCHTCGLIHKRIETIFDFLWLKGHQMSIKGSDQSVTNDNGYGDMWREMNQLTLMSECSKISR